MNSIEWDYSEFLMNLDLNPLLYFQVNAALYLILTMRFIHQLMKALKGTTWSTYARRTTYRWEELTLCVLMVNGSIQQTIPSVKVTVTRVIHVQYMISCVRLLTRYKTAP